ncbi:hypothetical protein IWQ62_000042 [Dispira parvispora]|uniref:MIT domain-containing protein n=1 Tax=Dispira parvispora TaxID=1520584 RepID=A0A9W8AVH2_9FUNG|nr:hypothetical protein IWQ62_000042 [Dispira parvispora]
MTPTTALALPNGTSPPDQTGSTSNARTQNTGAFRFLLHLALRKAQTAVILDERRHFVEAKRTYREAIDMISLIIDRVGDSAQNKERLVQLRQTYQGRIADINALIAHGGDPPSPAPDSPLVTTTGLPGGSETNPSHNSTENQPLPERLLGRAKSYDTLPKPQALSLAVAPVVPPIPLAISTTSSGTTSTTMPALTPPATATPPGLPGEQLPGVGPPPLVPARKPNWTRFQPSVADDASSTTTSTGSLVLEGLDDTSTSSAPSSPGHHPVPPPRPVQTHITPFPDGSLDDQPRLAKLRNQQSHGDLLVRQTSVKSVLPRSSDTLESYSDISQDTSPFPALPPSNSRPWLVSATNPFTSRLYPDQAGNRASLSTCPPKPLPQPPVNTNPFHREVLIRNSRFPSLGVGRVRSLSQVTTSTARPQVPSLLNRKLSTSSLLLAQEVQTTVTADSSSTAKTLRAQGIPVQRHATALGVWDSANAHQGVTTSANSLTPVSDDHRLSLSSRSSSATYSGMKTITEEIPEGFYPGDSGSASARSPRRFKRLPHPPGNATVSGQIPTAGEVASGGLPSTSSSPQPRQRTLVHQLFTPSDSLEAEASNPSGTVTAVTRDSQASTNSDHFAPGSSSPGGSSGGRNKSATGLAKLAQLPKFSLRGKTGNSESNQTSDSAGPAPSSGESRPLRRLGSFLLPSASGSSLPDGGVVTRSLSVAAGMPTGPPLPMDAGSSSQPFGISSMSLSPLLDQSLAPPLVSPTMSLTAVPSTPSFAGNMGPTNHPTLHDVIIEEPNVRDASTAIPARALHPVDVSGARRRRSGSSHRSPRSPHPPLEALPTQFAPWTVELQPYWLLRSLHQSMVHGAWVTRQLYIPRRVWYQSGARLPALDQKINACELLVGATHRMTHYTGATHSSSTSAETSLPGSSPHPLDNLDWVLNELTAFETLVATIQDGLAKKLTTVPPVRKSNTVQQQRHHPYQAAPPPPRSMFYQVDCLAQDATNLSASSLGLSHSDSNGQGVVPTTCSDQYNDSFSGGSFPNTSFVPTLPPGGPPMSPQSQVELASSPTLEFTRTLHMGLSGAGSPPSTPSIGPGLSAGGAFKALGKRMTKRLDRIQATYTRDQKVADTTQYIQALTRLCMAMQTLEGWTRWFSGWWYVLYQHQWHKQHGPLSAGVKSLAGEISPGGEGSSELNGQVHSSQSHPPPSTSSLHSSDTVLTSPDDLVESPHPSRLATSPRAPQGVTLGQPPPGRRPSIAGSILSNQPGLTGGPAYPSPLPWFAGSAQHQQIIHRLNRISEFLHTVVCAFILSDLQVLLHKYSKRLREWILG